MDAKLSQVVLSLSLNALDAVGPIEGGISVRPRRLEDDRIQLSVIDTGRDIDPEDLDKLFEPVFTTKPVGKGIGIGLATCYNIIRQHGFEETMSRKKNNTMEVKWPVFDPGPSCDFATKVFQETRIAGILIGRFAVWAWVSDPASQELTKDLDFAVRREDLPKILSYAEACGHRTWKLSIGGVNVADEEKRIKVDFIHRHSEEWGNLSPLFEHAIEEASEQGRSAVIGEQSYLLASAEHLIAMKIATMEARDDLDAKRILETVADIDIARLRALASDFLGAVGKAKLENLLRETGHPEARKRGKYIS